MLPQILKHTQASPSLLCASGLSPRQLWSDADSFPIGIITSFRKNPAYHFDNYSARMTLKHEAPAFPEMLFLT